MDLDSDEEEFRSSHLFDKSSSKKSSSKKSSSKKSSSKKSKPEPDVENVEDLLQDAHSESKSKLSLTTTRRLRELSLNSWTKQLFKKMFRGYGSQRTSERQALTVSKITKHVRHPFLTLTDVKVKRNEYKNLSGHVIDDDIRKVFFKLDDKIFILILSIGAQLSASMIRHAQRIFFVDNHKSLQDGGLICSLANLFVYNSANMRNKTGRVNGRDNSLIGANYRVAGNTQADAKEESQKMMVAIMTADRRNSLEIVAPDPEDMLEILNLLGSSFSQNMVDVDECALFLSHTDGSLMRGIDPANPKKTKDAIEKGVKLVSEIYEIFSKRGVKGLGGGSRRYSTKRRSLRKSRTVKNMK